MKVSLGWLGDLVEIPVDAATLAERLTKAGLEVEKVLPLGQGRGS